MACVIGELQIERNSAYWLQKFIDAVQEGLIKGSPEEEYFDTEDHEILLDAYERNMKMISGLKMAAVIKYYALSLIYLKFTLVVLLLPIVAIGNKQFVASIILYGNWNYLQMKWNQMIHSAMKNFGCVENWH